jgi:hypothetical protein
MVQTIRTTPFIVGVVLARLEFCRAPKTESTETVYTLFYRVVDRLECATQLACRATEILLVAHRTLHLSAMHTF